MTDVDWRQLTIVHISDLHFGRNHFFNPVALGAETKERSVLYSIMKDLNSNNFAFASEFFPAIQSEAAAPQIGGFPRTLFALTGDFNERSSEPEFKQAKPF